MTSIYWITKDDRRYFGRFLNIDIGQTYISSKQSPWNRDNSVLYLHVCRTARLRVLTDLLWNVVLQELSATMWLWIKYFLFIIISFSLHLYVIQNSEMEETTVYGLSLSSWNSGMTYDSLSPSPSPSPSLPLSLSLSLSLSPSLSLSRSIARSQDIHQLFKIKVIKQLICIAFYTKTFANFLTNINVFTFHMKITELITFHKIGNLNTWRVNRPKYKSV